MPNTLDEIARLVHESEELKRKLAQAERRAESWRSMYREIREERNELRARLRDEV